MKQLQYFVLQNNSIRRRKLKSVRSLILAVKQLAIATAYTLDVEVQLMKVYNHVHYQCKCTLVTGFGTLFNTELK